MKRTAISGAAFFTLLACVTVLTPLEFASAGNLRGTTTAQTSGVCCQGTRGNVNGTGIVDLADLSSLVNYLVGGGYVLPCPSAANINGAGIIDLADLSSLVNYLVGAGYVLPDCPITVTDADGNVYPTVTIGSHVWMAENLRVTHYRNGDSIPNVTDSAAWSVLATGACCEYSNDTGNVATYGRLYNWYAVADSRNIAPTGWHVATDSEWQALSDSLGGDAVSSGKLKEAGTSHWTSPNTAATNESGFSALPGGYRYFGTGTYYNIGNYASFWSSTENGGVNAWDRGLRFNYPGLYRYYDSDGSGFSVRCVKDY